MKSTFCLWLTVGGITLMASAKDLPSLPRSTPEKQGISSAAILDFVEAADKQIDTVHSFMLVRHGHVVAEGWRLPYHADSPHTMYSLSKSFTSTAVGLAIADGKLSLDDEVLKFFPEDAPAEPSVNLKAMRVRDLLEMSSGHSPTNLALFSFQSPEKLTRLFLSLPVEHKPGTHFLYNTPGSYMLSAIVQKVTGQKVLDYLSPRLFEPLGIENPSWEESPQGISLGGYGLSIRTEDIAKFGQLYLQKGKWQGKQLIPASWIEAATSRQTSNGSNPASDWDQGYGYQFWRCRPGCYRGDGLFGQFCIVIPEKDAVVAITSATRDMQGVMNLVWDKLLPAMKPEKLRADPDGDKKLKAKLASLTIPVQEGAASPGTAAQFSGKTYSFPTNSQKIESITLDFSAVNQPTTLSVRCDGKDYRVVCGKDEWKRGRMAYAALPEQPVAVSGAWTADGTYTAKLCFYETTFCITAKLQFSPEKLVYDADYNVFNNGPTSQPELTGVPH